MHSIRTDFGFNLLRSASKLKRGVIEKKMVSVGATALIFCMMFIHIMEVSMSRRF
jgi:hypothetical protein